MHCIYVIVYRKRLEIKDLFKADRDREEISTGAFADGDLARRNVK